MATDPGYLHYICEQSGLGSELTYKKMFGDYSLYLWGRVIGLVCDNQLFLKPTEPARALLGVVKEGFPYPTAKPHFLVDAHIDDQDALKQLLIVTAEALPIYIPKLRSKKTKTKPRTKASKKVSAARKKSARAKKTTKR